MSTHRYINRICIAGLLFSLILTLLFVHGEALGISTADPAVGYENRLFDTSRVHTIDLVMDGWDDFLETCENEEYSACSAVIDGEAYRNIGIRAKGNTSLSMVSSMDSDRYSFKLEFDQYDSGRSYYGLDKLCLNNIIQDNTYMKDYLTYQLMSAFGVNAPLCSYVYLTVNGEDWGLYLAVEGVEDGFLQRNYGSQYGDLYKPDSMSFGGGRGNGRDFSMGGFLEGGGDQEWMPEAGDFPQPPEGGRPEAPQNEGGPPEMGGGPGGFGGMGASDVKLQYIDEDPDSYENIFNSAKTEVTEADQARLIQALKNLSTGEDLENTVEIDQVIRYFVVHNFVCNGDSYTGSMVHNYYLYEEDGRLSMIPWDYNLAFGTFQASDAGEAVNDPIDTPLSVSSSGDRPMIDWIFADETYTAQYHQAFATFLETVDYTAIIDNAYRLIAPYVEQDPTKFCTGEEFEAGVTALKTFCQLRTESVSGQLDGTIPATREGQSAGSASLVDASNLNLSDMGTMNQGGGGFPGGPGGGERSAQEPGTAVPAFESLTEDQERTPEQPNGEQPTDQMQRGPGGPGENRVPDDGLSAAQAGNTLLLLGISVLVLLLGLLVAVRFRR